MLLGLFRHAEKQDDWSGDPALTAHGLLQAQRIQHWVQLKKLPPPERILTSPRKRAQSTLTPLAQAQGISVQVTAALDERQNHESQLMFRQRIENFLADLMKIHSSQKIFLCTHYDWIEEFLNCFPCEEDLHHLPDFRWSPGAFLLFEMTTTWKLIQKGKV